LTCLNLQDETIARGPARCADAPPTRQEPPWSRWRPAAGRVPLRDDLGRLAAAAADALGPPPMGAADPVFASGHQPWLWHGGILAKDLAALAAAKRHGGAAVHLVVDHDTLDEIAIDLPFVQKRKVGVERVVIAEPAPLRPLCFQPPVDGQAVSNRLRAARRDGSVDPSVLIEAWRDLPDCDNLARQLTAVLGRLRRAFAAEIPVVFATDLARLDAFARLVQRVLEDPHRCVRAYNAAAAAHPESAVAPLQLDDDLVELPLWAIEADRPRLRVFAQPRRRGPIPLLRDGTAADGRLVPRALLLTGFVRSAGCNLFVHGTGGAVYDRVTERWFASWMPDRPLAPMALVSADLRLALSAPVAEESDVRRAAWWAHHLPHNLDRALNLDGRLVRRKRQLLADMDRDRDRHRRGASFAEIHAINQQLASAHPEALAQAAEDLRTRRLGAANRAAMGRRDWCFGLHPAARIEALARALGDSS